MQGNPKNVSDLTTTIQWKSETRKLKELKDYNNNPRKMNKDRFDKLVESIKSDGYHQRLLINIDGTIIGGHARKKALLKSGYTDDSEIEVLVPNRLLEGADFDRVNIRDNLQYGDFDFDMLGNLFEPAQLIEWGMPEDLLQITKDDIEIVESDDDVPTAPIEPTAKLGDVWLLGEHKLMCGDSSNPLDMNKLLGDIVPKLMVTDPPYGVNYDPSWREGADLGVGERSKGKVLNDDRADWKDVYSLFPGSIIYAWHGAKHTHTVAQNLEDCGYDLIAQIIWAKQHFVLSRGDYHWQHEPCWYAVRKGMQHNWQGARDQATTWQIKNNNSFGNQDKEETVGHGTQKPIDCMLRPILNNSKAGDYIYDPFGGSGTTLIAAEKSKRKCLMIELSPTYCDVIVARWEKMTNKKGELVVD
jgi:site-specific DNA-methyltransferase (adenine-specific)